MSSRTYPAFISKRCECHQKSHLPERSSDFFTEAKGGFNDNFSRSTEDIRERVVQVLALK